MNKTAIPFLLAAALCACTMEESFPKAVHEEAESAAEETILVKFTPELCDVLEKGLPVNAAATRADVFGNLSEELGIVEMERLFPYSGEFEARTRREGLHRWYKVRCNSAATGTKAAEWIGRLPGVEISEEEPRIRFDAITNDPYSAMLWGVYDGQNPTASVNAVPVWNSYTTGCSEVIVGVIDGGIDLSHEDLASAVIPGGVDGSRNFVDGGFNIVAHDHGTHVAGTIGAIRNNGMGVCGIAGGDAAAGIAGVRLLSCQIFKEVDGKDVSSGGAAAIKWAADHGATIINNSWGYNYDKDNDGRLTGEELANALAATINSSDKDAVDYFIKYAGFDAEGNQTGPMAGGVVFFSAGNNSIANGAPANYAPVIAVGSTTSARERSSFSNYGEWVDIAAPGSDIMSTVPGGYGKMSGTSMACPHVTGVAALLLSYYGGKGFTNEQLKEKLLGGANPDVLPAGSQIGPLVDAMGAFAFASQEAPGPVGAISSSASANQLRLTFNVTGDSEGTPAYSYLVAASEDKSLIDTFDPFAATPDGVVTSVTRTDGKKVGESITVKVNGLDFSRDYYAVVLASNYFKRYSTVSAIVKQATYENNPPVIVPGEAGPYILKASEERTIPFSVYDPDDHKVTISFDGGSRAADYSFDQSAGECPVTIRGRRAEAGTYTATFTATDSYGASENYSFEYTILENEAPVAVKKFDDILLYGKGKSVEIDVAPYFSDPEGEEMTYKVQGNNNSLSTVSFSGSKMKVTLKSTGLVALEVVAVDAGNKQGSTPLRILAKDPDNLAESFPNPVIDFLYIRTEDEAPTRIILLNANGASIFDKELNISGFNPAKIDMSACPPGRYLLKISYSGKSFSRTIVKK